MREEAPGETGEASTGWLSYRSALRRKVQVVRHDHALKGKIRVIVVVVAVVAVFIPEQAA